MKEIKVCARIKKFNSKKDDGFFYVLEVYQYNEETKKWETASTYITLDLAKAMAANGVKVEAGNSRVEVSL